MLRVLFLFLFMTISASSKAAEGGGSQYLPGFYGDFGMATTPAAGTYMSNFFGYNWAENKDAESSLLFELPGVLHITESKILGANYWFGFFPYALHTTYTDKATGKEYGRGGAGDMYGVPAILSWKFDDLSIMTFEGIVPPTGAYSKDRILNAGRNSWTFDSNVGVTWSPDNGKYDLSLMFGYMVNTKNNATDYRSGDEVHIDWNVGYFLTDALGIGVGGSYYRQVTPDTGLGVPLNTVEGEASTIGPVITYTMKMGEKDVSFSAKWLHEYDVNNHIPGDYVILRTVFGF